MDRLPSLNQAHLLRLYRSLSKSDFCDKITQAAPASPLQCENLDSILKAVYDHYETYSVSFPSLLHHLHYRILRYNCC